MSSKESKLFLKESEEKAFDLDHRKVINYNIDKYNTAVEVGISRFNNLENAKRKAYGLKWKVLENLDKVLPEFESRFQERGGKVIWAENEEEAQQEIWKIIERSRAKLVIKSKSMVTEEINLNEFLTSKGVETLESDLGEYIVQLLGQKPYHIVTPAMHLNLASIAKLFHEKFNTPLNASAQELTLKAREILRDQYLKADVGITGANFLVADTGSVALTENEGNARLSTTFPKIHIAVVGIEKVIPSLTDLDLFWPLLSTHGTGQNLTVYNSLLNGPRQENETDGPEEMYVILLDNGRTNVLAQKEQRQGLYCIRCGACLNACPVYKNIGGHTYETTYSGPIGSLITPHMKGMEAFNHLSHASTLCGKCTEVCPVKINIHNMLLANRRDGVKQQLSPAMERIGWKVFTTVIMKRSWLDTFGGKFKNFVLSTFMKGALGKHRKLPVLPEKSFNQQWKEKQKQPLE